MKPGMAKRKRSEHYVNNKEFLAALIRYREDREMITMHQQYVKHNDKHGDGSSKYKLNRKMGYLSTINDAKESLEKIYKENNSKS